MSTEFPTNDETKAFREATIPDLGSNPRRAVNLKALAFVAVSFLMLFGIVWLFLKSEPKSNADVNAVKKQSQLLQVPAPPPRAGEIQFDGTPTASLITPQRPPASLGAAGEKGTASNDPNVIELVKKRKGYATGPDGKDIKLDEQSSSVSSMPSSAITTASGGANLTNLPESDPRRLFYSRYGSTEATSQIGLDGAGQTQDLVRRRAALSGEVSIMVGGRFLTAGEASTVQHASAQRSDGPVASFERRSTSAYSSGITATPSTASSAESRSAQRPTGTTAATNASLSVLGSASTLPRNSDAGNSAAENRAPIASGSQSNPMAALAAQIGSSSSLGGNVPSRSFDPQVSTADQSRKSDFPVVKARRIPLAADRFVLQGTMIRCVMQNQIVSTLEAPAMCNITSDVRSSDGSAVLIPAGSKVIGEYRRRDAQGERIAILWTRVVTPDNVDIAVGSVGTDPMGGAGIPSVVDAMILERFGNALFYSLFSDIFKVAMTKNAPTIKRTTTDSNGVVTTTEEAFDSVTVKNAERIVESEVNKALSIGPRLTVPQGTLISIAVAQDLDFSGIVQTVGKR
jgi:type IV secretory pathway VirB10-like protein